MLLQMYEYVFLCTHQAQFEKKPSKKPKFTTREPDTTSKFIQMAVFSKVMLKYYNGNTDDFVAIKIMKYHEELPQIEKVVIIFEALVCVNWLVGSYLELSLSRRREK